MHISNYQINKYAVQIILKTWQNAVILFKETQIFPWQCKSNVKQNKRKQIKTKQWQKSKWLARIILFSWWELFYSPVRIILFSLHSVESSWRSTQLRPIPIPLTSRVVFTHCLSTNPNSTRRAPNCDKCVLRVEMNEHGALQTVLKKSVINNITFYKMLKTNALCTVTWQVQSRGMHNTN